ncbi:MAG: endonuclease V [Candidatus Nanopelagicales bacterium]
MTTVGRASRLEWPADADALVAEQRRLGGLTAPPWSPPDRPLLVGAAFVAFLRGQQGPGQPGDRAWVGAVLTEGTRVVAERVVEGVAGATYVPGLLALREGPMLAAAVEALPRRPDMLLVDGTGRDHERGAGLALQLGALLDLPSVGVTHRPLRATGDPPGPARGDSSALLLAGVEVARWIRTVPGARPVVAHAGWRTDAAVATEVVLRCGGPARTPEPLRQARRVAREHRSAELSRT